jgi:SAM-dependent methyltransferase
MKKLLIDSSLILENGIYISRNSNAISYPTQGNEQCFQIEDESFWFNYRNRVLIFLINKYKFGNTFLDVGGGNGFVSSELFKNNINVILLEPGFEGCLNAKKRGVEQIICSSLDRIILDKNKIGNIGVFDVIEHIEKDDEFILNLNRQLMNGGKLFVTVPAHKFLWSQEDIDAGHYTRYSLKEIKNKLIQNGFKIEYSTYFFSILILPILIFRTIPTFLKIYKKKNNDHSPGKIEKILNYFLKFEFKKIINNRKIFFGTSCLIIAKKINEK